MLEHALWSPGHLTVRTIRTRRGHAVEVLRDGNRLAEADEHGIVRATDGLVLAEAPLFREGPGEAAGPPAPRIVASPPSAPPVASLWADHADEEPAVAAAPPRADGVVATGTGPARATGAARATDAGDAGAAGAGDARAAAAGDARAAGAGDARAAAAGDARAAAAGDARAAGAGDARAASAGDTRATGAGDARASRDGTAVTGPGRRALPAGPVTPVGLAVDVFGVRQGEVRVTAAVERLRERVLRADLLVDGDVAAGLRTVGSQAEQVVVRAGDRELARLARFDRLRGVRRTVSSWDLEVTRVDDPRLRVLTVASLLRLPSLRDAAAGRGQRR